MSTEPARTLYAAFLWWVVVLAVQAGLNTVVSGVYFQFLYNGATAGTLLGIEVGLAVLSLLVLWAGFFFALRPGALEPPPLLLHWAAPLAAVLLLLTSMGVGLLMPTVRTATLAHVLGAEGLALGAQGHQIIAVAGHALRGITYAVVLVVLWRRVTTGGKPM